MTGSGCGLQRLYYYELNSSLFATIFEGPVERTDSLSHSKSVSRARARLRDGAEHRLYGHRSWLLETSSLGITN